MYRMLNAHRAATAHAYGGHAVFVRWITGSAPCAHSEHAEEGLPAFVAGANDNPSLSPSA